MKRNWLRHLNPFHFETRTLFWMAWANVILAIGFCLLALAVYIFLRPQAAWLGNITGKAAIHVEKTADANHLRENLISQLNNDHDVWQSLFNLWGAIAFLFAVVAFVGLGNAVYQFKAYKLLKAKPSDSSS